jgi:hypothetical protein
MRKWPTEIEDAVARAIVAGVPTMRVYQGVRSGSLEGLSRGYAMPERTFMQTLARVRERFLETVPAPGSGDFMARLRVKVRREAEEQANRARESDAPPLDWSPAGVPLATSTPERERNVEAVVQELRRLAESENLESLPGSQPGSAHAVKTSLISGPGSRPARNDEQEGGEREQGHSNDSPFLGHVPDR